MRISCLATILQFNGKDAVLHPDGLKATFRSIVTEIMGIRLQDDPKTTDFSVKCFNIGLKVNKTEFADFTVDELAFIKERVAKINYGHVTVARVSEIVENAAASPQE